ncbi:MAG: 2-amino-4-hydroxy-6-hydroxymethyldihydropteridine diphosphokinase [Polyangiaceae bacterium]|nr:2-amino-4-hydroxy-6-hydroxymethyldihydropteridine diphosphokinase [Polyangiaceae bacterium]MCB9609191.1 2-amino-4-hydroxy-6-hydroxymethyldihydropteridine diphosphokinase [Polyangiaceae bacterium]
MSAHERRVLFVVGLGTNLGDRLATLRSAREALGVLGRVVASSGVYETAPIGPAQPDFLNAAVLLESSLSAPALLENTLQIERNHGRERRERWGPRTLDLDLLWSDGPALELPQLTLPHPRVLERAFALMPLLDVFPSHPEKPRFEAQLQRLDRLGVRSVAVTPEWQLHDPDSLAQPLEDAAEALGGELTQ